MRNSPSTFHDYYSKDVFVMIIPTSFEIIERGFNSRMEGWEGIDHALQGCDRHSGVNCKGQGTKDFSPGWPGRCRSY